MKKKSLNSLKKLIAQDAVNHGAYTDAKIFDPKIKLTDSQDLAKEIFEQLNSYVQTEEEKERKLAIDTGKKALNLAKKAGYKFYLEAGQNEYSRTARYSGWIEKDTYKSMMWLYSELKKRGFQQSKSGVNIKLQKDEVIFIFKAASLFISGPKPAKASTIGHWN